MTASHAPTARIVLGVSGGIAAYKACSLLRGLVEVGHRVQVVATPAALRFVGEATWAALSGQPVATELFDDAHEVPHVRLGQQADLVVVAPATADLLARAAAGRADDLLTATLLTARCPVLLAPAMHTEMWTHPATRHNVATLRERGVLVLDPASGRLTGPDSGPGRLPEPADLLAWVQVVLARSAGSPGSTPDGAAPAHGGFLRDLTGRRVVVTAGGTREPLDPVRFLGNHSSGRQGIALARAAAVRGAEVTLVLAHAEVPEPTGMRVVRVGTTAALRDAVLAALPGADALVMAAAPADFRPTEQAEHKIKKGENTGLTLTLVQTPDVLGEVVAARRSGGVDPGCVIAGFAAETGDATGDAITHGRQKLARKGVDLLVVNDVAAAPVFGAEENGGTILGRDGSSRNVPRGPKEVLAHALWDEVVPRWGGSVGGHARTATPGSRVP